MKPEATTHLPGILHGLFTAALAAALYFAAVWLTLPHQVEPDTSVRSGAKSRILDQQPFQDLVRQQLQATIDSIRFRYLEDMIEEEEATYLMVLPKDFRWYDSVNELHAKVGSEGKWQKCFVSSKEVAWVSYSPYHVPQTTKFKIRHRYAEDDWIESKVIVSSPGQ